MRGLPPIHDPARTRHATGNCRTTGKLRYRTRKKALKAPNSLGTPRKVYRCIFCDRWHVTSQEQRS